LLRSGRFLTKSRCRRSIMWWMIGSTDWERVFNSEDSTFFNERIDLKSISYLAISP
jgi:hypothetical protein